MTSCGSHAHVYPVDPESVAHAQPGEVPPDRDPRIKRPKDSACPGCRHFRARHDWAHNREIGECSYPHDHPWIPECTACQKRALRYHEEHTYEQGKCKWALALSHVDDRSRPLCSRPSAHLAPSSMQHGGASSSGENRQVAPDAQADPDFVLDRHVRRHNLTRRNDQLDFDIGRFVRLCKTNRPGAMRLSLKKLHVRWCHAPVMVMTKLLA